MDADAPGSEPIETIASLTVEYLDLENMTVVLSNGVALPIAYLVDEFGDEPEEMSDIHSILAGSAEQGWYEFEVEFNINRPIYH